MWRPSRIARTALLLWELFGCFLVVTTTVFADNNDFLAPVIGSSDPLAQGLPVFQEEPLDNYYVVKSKPVTITCKATPAILISFNCAGTRVERSRQQNFELVSTVTGVKTLSSSITVTREEVEEYYGGGYWCECEAWNTVPGSSEPVSVKSKRGLVEVAKMRRFFQRVPMSKSVEAQFIAQLECLPPEGKPMPEVFWLKDGEPIDVKKDINFIISSEGNLIVSQARLEDTGNYTCGAVNPAGRRVSDSATLTVYINGGWSTWSSWSECSVPCGKGKSRRTRTCSNPSPVNGGQPCVGEHFQTTVCTPFCPVDGMWSPWTSWTTCSTVCTQIRRRFCDNPTPQNGGQGCLGHNYASTNCTGGMCRETHKSDSGVEKWEKATSHAVMNENIPLYVGLCVAVAVFIIVVVIVVIVMRRKSAQQQGVFDSVPPRADTNLHPLSEDEKKINKNGDMLSVQPDLTQNVVPVQHGLPMDSPNNNHVDVSPLYSTPVCIVPETKSQNRLSGTLSKTPKSMMEPSINHNLNTSMEKLTIKDNKGALVMNPGGRMSPGGDNLQDSRQSVISMQLPSTIDADAVTWSTFSHTGGRMVLPESGVSLTIPEGAIKTGHVEEIYMAVCRDDKDRPRLHDKQTIISPVILVGPPGLVLKKPVILSFQHCASMRHGAWLLSVYASPTPADESPQWQNLVTLGHETINTPLYAQLDPSHCHLVTEYLQRYALIGESVPGGKPVKILRLAAFAPTTPAAMEYSIRVYVVEDTVDALEGVIQVERKLGGRLLDKPKQIPFQDGGNNLCLTIEELSPGWRSKLAANYQEIPFRHIWSGNQNNLHCSFSLELVDRSQAKVSCKIQVYQKAILSNRQVLLINSNLKEKLPLCPTPSSTLPLKQRGSTVTTNSTNSSGFSSMVTLDPSGQVFRLPPHIKGQLCMLLDPPNARGNDWRMLAQALTVDRYINFFATKPSPTEHILDLWEARHREESALTDLMNIFRVMGRMDAAAVLEKDMGSWL